MIEARTDLPAPARLAAIDIARGIALAAMIVYHFVWDLEFFGYLPFGTAAQGGWMAFARSIAASFLVLVGVGLVLAHGRGIRWRAFARRLAAIAGAALAITAATRIATPDGYIFFGILHCIAVASLLGLAFVRLPILAVVAASVAALVAGTAASAPVLDHPAFVWLVPQPVRSNDYVPLLPWFAAVLAGIAGARLAGRLDLFARIAGLQPRARSIPALLAFAGRHSLIVYLVHQPALFALLALAGRIVPAA